MSPKNDKWKNSLQEPVSKDHENSVMNAAAALLKQNESLASESKKQIRWMYYVLPGLAVGAAAILLVVRPGHQAEEPLSPEIEIALEMEMFQDLHEIENMELLEKLGDPEKWQTKKAKPRKS